MRQILKQPNGLYAEYSTIVDAFVLLDATKEEIILEAEREAARDAREKCEAAFKRLESGSSMSSPFAVTWEEAVENHNKNSELKDRISGDKK